METDTCRGRDEDQVYEYVLACADDPTIAMASEHLGRGTRYVHSLVIDSERMDTLVAVGIGSGFDPIRLVRDYLIEITDNPTPQPPYGQE